MGGVVFELRHDTSPNFATRRRLNLADRASFGIVDLEDDKVPGREHDVEIVRVDPEQDRGHSTELADILYICR